MFEPARRTIHQPWAQVALEGLRRLDEGVAPGEAFPEGTDVLGLYEDIEPDDEQEEAIAIEAVKANAAATAADEPIFQATRDTATSFSSSPLSGYMEGATAAGGSGKRPMIFSVIAVAAVLLIVAAVGVPAGWYGKDKAIAVSSATTPPATDPIEQTASAASDNPTDAPANEVVPSAESIRAESSATIKPGTTSIIAQQRDRERSRAAVEAERLRAAAAVANALKPVSASAAAAAAPASANNAAKLTTAKAAPKMATVQVTYDEAGRVTAASGGDGTAQRIARQKRFPTGKAGSATVTIPIN